MRPKSVPRDCAEISILPAYPALPCWAFLFRRLRRPGTERYPVSLPWLRSAQMSRSTSKLGHRSNLIDRLDLHFNSPHPFREHVVEKRAQCANDETHRTVDYWRKQAEKQA